MKRINYTTSLESWEAQHTAGRYNPATVLKVKGQEFTISAGQSDRLEVFQDGTLVHVLSVNRRLGYVGIEIFGLVDGAAYGDLFVQDEDELKDLIGPKGLDYSELTIAKRLAQFID